MMPHGPEIEPRLPRSAKPSARTSAQAVIALALSLIACCPFISMLGAVIGLLAYRRIVMSQGRLGGRRIALTAVCLGAGLGLAGSAAWSWFYRSADRTMRESITSGVPTFVQRAQQGDGVTALRWWDARAAPLDAQAVVQFGRETAERYGQLREFRITSFVAGGGLLTQTREVAGTFVFATGERPGSATFSVLPAATFDWPEMRLRRLVIDDPERGRLELPQATAATQTASTTAPAP